ncbi:hypothetical protein [Phenylobacterium sp.]|uniref:hypothetical protein n=1 Tax=Phenylobacterium sp. TaxID=1871053 RepID=UPI0035ADA434
MNRSLLTAALAASLLLAASAVPAGAHNGVDDEPHHGGVVTAYRDMHFELAAKPTGAIEIYFSDAMGEPLPASAVSQVAVEIEHPGKKTEYVDMRIDPTGVFWTGTGAPLADAGSVLHVGFFAKGKSALADVKGAAVIAAAKKGPEHHHGH